VPIGPDMRMAVVGAPSYFEARSHPSITVANFIDL